jgi:iron complex outermembrane receptor protein
MTIKQTPIASAVALLMLGAAAQVHAQAQAQAPATPPTLEKKDEPSQTVTVTGIRASLQQSLNVKRASTALVEVITAEDIGKMPDKNVADSLQRLPGVTISSASASEGGFDENDRVSLRGTSPSLTQTTINGHMVSSGDWFVLNQVGTVGRSVSYSLLPSELVRRVEVRKGQTADLVEGGVAGNVDILTHQPLLFQKQLTLEASVGGVYADLPDTTDPQFNGMISWKNEASTFGVLLQGFYEKRHLRRDGQEMLGYSTIGASSPLAASNPDLVGVAYPNVIGAALFEQVRERKGALLGVQVKPLDNLTLGLSGFHSEMEATNYNRNWMLWTTRILGGGGGQAPQAPDPGYIVRNGTLVSATWTPIVARNVGGTLMPNQYVIVDQIYRPGANSLTEFLDLDAKWDVSDRLRVTGRIGQSKGVGETPEQAVFEGDVFGTGATYALNGTSSPASTGVLAGNPANFAGTALDWVFGASPARTDDKEKYAQADVEWAVDRGVLASVKGGARFAEHTRSSIWIAQGPNFAADPFNPANLPAWNGETYPADFGKDLGGTNVLRNVWQLSPDVLKAWGDKYSNRDPITRRYFPGEFSLKEDATALYLMGNLEGQRWTGNVGVRVVQTKERVLVNVAVPTNPTNNPATPTDCAPLAPCSVPGAITTSAFGAFYQQEVANDYTDWLPSAQFKYNFTNDLVGRLGVAKTMARPDFSALGGAVSLDDTNHTGNGGNPNLKPIRSTNFDLAMEWYFAPRSLLQAGVFYMDLTNYVSFGTAPTVYHDIRTGTDQVYNVSSPINSSGHVGGVELAWQQPIWGGFGALANYTYADGHETGGGELVGTSRHTANLSGYFENDRFNARLNYTFRSAFFNGLDRSSAQHQDDTGTLSASIGFKINNNLTLSFDAMNLNDPTLKYYAANRDQPTAFYNNGRQYYLTLRGRL